MFTLLATTQAGNVPVTTNEVDFTAGIIVGIVIIFLSLFGCLINWLVVDAAKAAAPEHRTMKPGLFWLMLIPIFNVCWAFKALPAVSNSLKATLDAKGQAGGDAGHFAGLAFAWIQVAGVLLYYIAPHLWHGFFVQIALLIIYTAQVRKARKMIIAAG